MGDVERNKDNPVGAHNVRTLILSGHNFLSNDTKIARMAGGDRGNVRLKLPAAGPPEESVAG